MTDSVRCADDGGEFLRTQLQLNGPLSSRPILLTVSVMALAIGLAGCACEPAPREMVQREVRAKPVRLSSPVRAHADARQQAELRVRRPDPALLAPQPAPNCEFKRADIKAVDPDGWARLKAEYERQCFQDAEMAARDRLRQLQAAGLCEIERTAPQPPDPVSIVHARPKS